MIELHSTTGKHLSMLVSFKKTATAQATPQRKELRQLDAKVELGKYLA